MKLSLSWILEHIKGISLADIDISSLVERFNGSVAEIASYKQWKFPHGMSVMRVTRIGEELVEGMCLQQNSHLSLPMRNDCFINACFFVFLDDAGTARWATMRDMGSDKEGFFAAIHYVKDWKRTIDVVDWVIEVDNKSITHRGDLWSHRGMAREIAFLLERPMLPMRMRLPKVTVVEQTKRFFQSTKQFPFSIDIRKTDECSNFSALYVPQVSNRSSSIAMAMRLARIDSKPINALVDSANYVLFDIGQPMHAFDASVMQDKHIVVRNAYEQESIDVLDGATLALRHTDIVVADSTAPLSLAGIIGGAQTKVTGDTTSVLVEAATFNATAIRRSALFHKKRTESAVRFEKTTDDSTLKEALALYYTVLKKEKLIGNQEAFIVSCGAKGEPLSITLAHSTIEKAIGVPVNKKDFITIMKRIGFAVQAKQVKGHVLYTVDVPHWRTRKDIRLPIDIIEEFVRLWGFEHITPSLPRRLMQAQTFGDIYDVLYTLKMICAYALVAQEVQNYAVYDEPFLHTLGWQPDNAVEIANPMSQHAHRLVTTLIPHLLKNLMVNKIQEKGARFFEVNMVWHKSEDTIKEFRVVSGAWILDKGMSFYDGKQQLSLLFESVHLPVEWSKTTQAPWWLHPYQSALIMHNNNYVGFAGIVQPLYAQNIGISETIFAFELVVDALTIEVGTIIQYKAPSKFPSTFFDISCFIPVSVSVADIESCIRSLDERINDVRLIDFYEKDEWTDKRSVTVRCIIQDPLKTLQKNDVDAVYAHIVESLKGQFNVQVR